MWSYLNPLPHLPAYRGPYKVGSSEFEVPVSEIHSSTVAPDDSVLTIKFRIFYPTTASAKARKSISWLPEPQKAWNHAWASFLGMSERRASWFANLPSVLNYATIPAVQNAPLLNSKKYPVIVFSHGLGGNFNTYSSLLGSLASCGIVCVAPEHRDGSAPISFIKSSHTQVHREVAYVKVAHTPTAEVLNTRNAQLRVRLWELGLLHTVLVQLNQRKQFTNFADTMSKDDRSPTFKNSLDLEPGRITWTGHSFGSATMVQFVKSTYYHEQAPTTTPKPSASQDWDMTPLYIPSSDSELVKQILPQSPVALLDLWTMPLRGEPSRWLWEKPLPCYEHESTTTTPSVISVISTEFYKWSELRNRVCAVLSADADKVLAEAQNVSPDSQTDNALAPPPPASRTTSKKTPTNPTTTSQSQPQAEKDLHEPNEPDLNPIPTTEETPSTPSTRTPSPSHSDTSPSPSSHSSTTSLPPPSTSTSTQTTNPPAHLYLIPHSAHLSQSDFGPLFPNLTRYFMHAVDPHKILELNVRAILALMRNSGLEVESLDQDVPGQVERDARDMFGDDEVVERWERVRW